METIARVLFILLLRFLHSVDCGNVRVFADPGTCLISKNETFSGVRLGCVKCQWDTRIKNDSRSNPELRFRFGDCRCPSGFWNSRNVCKICQGGTVSEDQRSCLPCTAENPYNEGSGKCVPCPPGHIQVVQKVNGGRNNRFVCEKCGDGFTPSRSTESCIPCHPSFPRKNNRNGICNCTSDTEFSLSNGVCIPNAAEYQYDPLIISKITYDNAASIESSQFLRENLLSAFYLCKEGKNESACQIVANSCVMQLYVSAEEGNSACKLYELLIEKNGGDVEGRGILPKLLYEDHYLILHAQDFIPKEFTSEFNEPSSDINITVARYTVDGQFLGLSPLLDVIPCQGQLETRRMKQKFGVTTRSQCKLRVREFWNLRPAQMEFLDTFLSVEEGLVRSLYSIPVKIQNIKRKGFRVNEDEAEVKWFLYRRFFMLDSIGGSDSTVDPQDHSSRSNKTPKVVRYVEKINVGIELQKDEQAGRIYVPVITIYYNEFTSEDFRSNEEISFTYEVEYFMDMKRAIEDIKISIGVISSLAVIWAALQTWAWNRRSGSAEIDLETILTLLLTSCGHIADAFVVVCFTTALYWWIFFKKQVAVHVFLPQPPQERIIRDLLISAFALKVVDVLKLIGRQVCVDIFFVDWEKSKAGSVIQAPNEEQLNTSHAAAAGSAEDKQSVSIWRSYFVANEWNEIQSVRKVNTSLQIIFTLLLLEIFGLKHWGLHWPNTTLNPGPEASDVPYSTVARFTTSTIVFGMLGLFQWLYTVGIYERFFSNKIQDFVDVCTLANISVFILAAKQYGYYIHGRSVHGFADTDMRTMVEQLSREEEDLCGRRGLVATYDQQTFIMSVPRSLRLVYDQVLQPLYASSKFAGQGRPSLILTGSKGSTPGITKPGSSQLNLSAHAYHSMNRFLTSFLEHALSDIDYEVKDKSFIESTLDMEFREGGDRAVFYNDNGHSFDAAIFYGNERTLFLFDLYLFNFIDLLSHNFVLAGLVTFLVNMGLKFVRNYFGKRNLARKTLIDQRFLI